MPTARVQHTIGDLVTDCARIGTTTRPKLVPVVRRNVVEGRRLAQKFARAASGPHGKRYYKRITDEMTGPLEGEYGPTGDVVGNAVGAGWRHGPPNTDLQKSADIQEVKFGKDVRDVVKKQFW